MWVGFFPSTNQKRRCLFDVRKQRIFRWRIERKRWRGQSRARNRQVRRRSSGWRSEGDFRLVHRIVQTRWIVIGEPMTDDVVESMMMPRVVSRTRWLTKLEPEGKFSQSALIRLFWQPTIADPLGHALVSARSDHWARCLRTRILRSRWWCHWPQSVQLRPSRRAKFRYLACRILRIVVWP